MKDDAVYASAFEDATRMAGDFLEDEAIRRATEGVERKIFHQGEHVDNETVYSDTLLIFTLKGAKPQKYRDNIKIEQEITVHLESSLSQGMKRLEELRASGDIRRIA
jgi:hypothetical protein